MTQPISIICEDPIIHIDEKPVCNDPTCPCQPERGARVLIEVEIADLHKNSMLIAGGWMPLSRIRAIVEQEQEEQEDDPESDMEERLARQAARHLEARGYFDMWGLHEDLF